MTEEQAQFFDLHRLANLSGVTSSVMFRRNQVLFAQGDPADAVFYIQEGRVKMTVISDHRKEAVIAMLDAGSFCGEGCLGGQLRTTSAVAMTDCVVARLEKDVVAHLLHDDKEFSEQFTTYLLARNIRAEADVLDQLFNSSEKRLARLLLLLANFSKDGKPSSIIPAVSQETLAEMVGTTRSRVSRFMNRFRQQGLIDYNGNIHVHKKLLNALLLGDIGKRAND